MNIIHLTGGSPEEVAAKAAAMGFSVDPRELKRQQIEQAQAEHDMFALMRQDHGYTETDCSILKYCARATQVLMVIAQDDSLKALVEKHDYLPAATFRAALYDLATTIRRPIDRAALLASPDNPELRGMIMSTNASMTEEACKAREQLVTLQAKHRNAAGVA